LTLDHSTKPIRGEEHVRVIRITAATPPASTYGRLVRRLVVVKSLPFWGSAGLQRRADGLLHDVNPMNATEAGFIETDEWN